MQPGVSSHTGAVNSVLRRIRRPPHDDVRFADRHDARRLASLLERFRDEDPVIVGIPRGGVPVAAEVARALDAPLDIVLVRKLGAPGNPEYAIGALAEGGVRVMSAEAVHAVGLHHAGLERLIAHTQAELDDRLRRYRGGRSPVPLEGRTVLLVDDGLATGRSARAAALSLRRRGPARLVLAVPVAAPSSAEALRDCVDEIVCVAMPADLWAIGLWYHDFQPTSDAEVATLLAEHDAADRPVAQEVGVEAGPDLLLTGDLTLPAAPAGVVAFAHGSGSSRRSPRNRAVATALNQAGIATLLFDLLTPAEEADRANVFDIPLLAERLLAVTRWLRGRRRPRRLPAARLLRGASTGAERPPSSATPKASQAVAAVVSRRRPGRSRRPAAGRGRRAGEVAGRSSAQEDGQVLALNRRAQRHLASAPTASPSSRGLAPLLGDPAPWSRSASWRSRGSATPSGPRTRRRLAADRR